MGIDERLVSNETADEAFGRWLLDSAKTDAIAEGEVRAAWTRFARHIGTITAVGSAGAAAGHLRSTARRAALGGLAVGSLLGGAVAVAWMGHQATSGPQSAPPSATATKIDPSENLAAIPPHGAPGDAPAPSARSSAALPSPPANHRFTVSKPSSIAAPPMPSPSPAPSPPPEPAPRALPSTLTAEILVLDRTRQAIAAKDFARALDQIDGYHRDFPRGQLAADADALAVEILDARGDHKEASRHAVRFISEHPNDPHSARMKLLIDE
jgi:hypothetical protein